MEKILSAYKADPSNLAKAQKLSAYANRHPMAECLLSPEDYGWLRQAKTQASAFKYKAA